MAVKPDAPADATANPGKILIGTSGWSYDHWLGPFYPEGLNQDDFLGFYADHFATVEINSTFYGLPEERTLRAWSDATPADFVFACKASRYTTHMKKLNDPHASTARFFDAIEALGGKLGPILFQLPPHWHVNLDRLAAFLGALPTQYRYAFEFRDETWFSDETCALLEQHGAAFCIYDLNRRRSPVVLTARFAYVRLHGPDGPYRGRYDGRTLAGWARRFKIWSDEGLYVYCYFDNDELGHAASDAHRLIDMIARR